MAYDTILIEQRDQVAHVTLNRPDKLNALDLALIGELRAAAAAIDADPGIRAVLLTGAGRAFSSGADLTRDDFFKDPSQTLGEAVGWSLTEHFNPMIDAWHRLRAPVVVAVNGIAAGAGMSLALVGDIVVAARSASFLQLFAPKLGLIPDLGSSFHLPRLVGTARAKGLCLLGDPLTAALAQEWGLIWACVDDAVLLTTGAALAQRLAAGPTRAFTRIKEMFNSQPAPSLHEQMAREAAWQAELGDSRDFAEGIQAFRAKRPPRFTGG